MNFELLKMSSRLIFFANFFQKSRFLPVLRVSPGAMQSAKNSFLVSFQWVFLQGDIPEATQVWEYPGPKRATCKRT